MSQILRFAAGTGIRETSGGPTARFSTSREFTSLLAAILISVMGAQSLVPSNAAAAAQCEDVFSLQASGGPRNDGMVDISKITEEKFDAKPTAGRLIPEKVQLKAYNIEPLVIPKDKNDPNYQSTLFDILRMLVETAYESGSPKLTIEKGELHLARDIGNGRSVEFEYIGDKRGAKTVFRLDRVLLYKANGQSIMIDKAPVSDDGLRLNRRALVLAEKQDTIEDQNVLAAVRPLEIPEITEWSTGDTALQDLIKSDKRKDVIELLGKMRSSVSIDDQKKLDQMKSQIAKIQAPIVLEGAMLEDVLTWVQRLPNLPRSQIRAALQDGHIKKLIFYANTRKNIKLVANVMRKQVLKYVAIGAVFAGAYGVTQELPAPYSGYVQSIPMIGKFMPHEKPITPDQAAIVNQVIEKLRAGGVTDPTLNQEVQNREAAGAAKAEAAHGAENVIELAQFEKVVHDLTAAETAAGGNVTFYLTDLAQHVTRVNAADVDTVRNKTESGYLIASFDHLQKLLLVPIVQKSNATLPTLSIIEIDRQTHQQVYDLLMASFVTH